MGNGHWGLLDGLFFSTGGVWKQCMKLDTAFCTIATVLISSPKDMRDLFESRREAFILPTIRSRVRCIGKDARLRGSICM